ncbi:hypothetical protein [Pyrobaculum aerophilum]|uniref:Uncharacterized protein n=2 Tax=Pyrobaculum aerophilum TaxID=13773 RepID=Q8ZU51_PYRAE|nr:MULTISPECIES: hypothetical protein [Pyrobaculum]AAL64557.1 hypothetical protein PAE2945 [Pyrobaculum aerophilum str. IM2]RFA93483.1 hypothetical protein CGL51_12840 [Pyrobaculum aerophilum]RFB00451.1 hypothetical protein CGL52_00340 [Pyrobaculum aerophilum]HII47400.1 hypothetical protein [Pyrobaculum aerophilum]
MIAAPPAIIIVPLASKEQVLHTVNYVVSKIKQIGVGIRHVHSDGPIYIQSRNSKDGIMERVDVYIASAGGDFANVLPVREEIKEGFIERTGIVHLVQGVAVVFRYKLAGEPQLEEVVIYTAGGNYRDFKL